MTGTPLHILKAQRLLDDQGIKGEMIGTGALWMHGYNTSPHDMDFLVERLPEIPAEFEVGCISGDEDSGEGMARIDGVLCHFVPYEHASTATDHSFDLIDGVRVATVENILALKRCAGRDKDKQFFVGWDAAQKRKE